MTTTQSRPNPTTSAAALLRLRLLAVLGSRLPAGVVIRALAILLKLLLAILEPRRLHRLGAGQRGRGRNRLLLSLLLLRGTRGLQSLRSHRLLRLLAHLLENLGGSRARRLRLIRSLRLRLRLRLRLLDLLLSLGLGRRRTLEVDRAEHLALLGALHAPRPLRRLRLAPLLVRRRGRLLLRRPLALRRLALLRRRRLRRRRPREVGRSPRTLLRVEEVAHELRHVPRLLRAVVRVDQIDPDRRHQQLELAPVRSHLSLGSAARF